MPTIANAQQSAASSAQTILHSGVWTKKSFKASGQWEIYSANGATFIRLSSDFNTQRAPDLKIFLSPLSASETTGRNATKGSLLVSPLRSNSGAQAYRIPDGVDINEFKSVLIHCEAYSKLWSVADLST